MNVRVLSLGALIVAAVLQPTGSATGNQQDGAQTRPRLIVMICPICGRTGEYEGLRGNLVELVHDPLGLELLMNGTIRNQVVRFEDDHERSHAQYPIRSLDVLKGQTRDK